MGYVSKRDRAIAELLKLSESKPDKVLVVTFDQEKKLKAEIRLKFGMAVRGADQIFDDMVATGRIRRIIPVFKKEYSSEEALDRLDSTLGRN